jgi:hypothetical protein
MRTSGYYSMGQQIIFPIHLKLLVLLGATTLFQGIMLAVFKALSSIDEKGGKGAKDYETVFASFQALSFGLSHIVIEGITLLLLSSGIGKRAIKRATVGGVVVGLLVGVCTYIYTVFRKEIANDIWQFSWLGLLVLFYWIVWLWPKSIIHFTRRPALLYWARFWAIYRLMTFIAFLLQQFGVDLGYCIFHVTVFVCFGVLKCWVAYRAFVLEAMFWHGVEGSTEKIPCCWSSAAGGSDNLMSSIWKSSSLASRPTILEEDGVLDEEKGRPTRVSLEASTNPLIR